MCLSAKPLPLILCYKPVVSGMGWFGACGASVFFVLRSFRSCLAGTWGITPQTLLAVLVQMVLRCSCAHHSQLPLASSCFSCLKRQQKILSAFPVAHFPGKVCPEGHQPSVNESKGTCSARKQMFWEVPLIRGRLI